jgi:hypothetical protein
MFARLELQQAVFNMIADHYDITEILLKVGLNT